MNIKTQEAINVLEKYKNIPKSDVVRAAYDIAVSALEKQMPQKPINIVGRYWGVAKSGNCPICGSGVNSKEYQYCRKCGQAINWSDTK